MRELCKGYGVTSPDFQKQAVRKAVKAVKHGRI